MRYRIFHVYIYFLLLWANPAVQAQSPGMHVDGRYLYSANGDTVILKGFNAMIVYWDIHGDRNFPEIEKTGANCVRIFWNLAAPTPQPADLDKVLGNCIKHHMIPIISLWEATGKWDKIQYCVDYWCSAEILPILQKYQDYLLLNIANEPGDKAMADTVFRNTYTSAVNQLRTAGLHMPLIIDADNWGRHADAVLDNGPYLLEEDPDKNLIFSWHLWDPSNWGTGTTSEINRIINKAAATNICFIVGEFGPCEQCDKCTSTKINWEYMIEKAFKNHIGYLPWVWKWTDCHAIVNNETGAYGSWVNPGWGEEVAVKNAYSIQNTAKKPSELQTSLNAVPVKLPLSSVSPNPFTREVLFTLRLGEPSKVRIVISDLYGRTIKTLTDRLFESGEINLPWSSDESGLSIQHGVYIYLLYVENESGCTVETGKMINL
jgi:mannan endo-1,4-beta-mannosidase